MKMLSIFVFFYQIFNYIPRKDIPRNLFNPSREGSNDVGYIRVVACCQIPEKRLSAWREKVFAG